MSPRAGDPGGDLTGALGQLEGAGGPGSRGVVVAAGAASAHRLGAPAAATVFRVLESSRELGAQAQVGRDLLIHSGLRAWVTGREAGGS